MECIIFHIIPPSCHELRRLYPVIWFTSLVSGISSILYHSSYVALKNCTFHTCFYLFKRDSEGKVQLKWGRTIHAVLCEVVFHYFTVCVPAWVLQCQITPLAAASTMKSSVRLFCELIPFIILLWDSLDTVCQTGDGLILYGYRSVKEFALIQACSSYRTS